MEIKKFEVAVEQYNNADELSEKEKNLLQEARVAVKNSYAPYSEFHVGAAVLLENGEIIHGNNQENTAYQLMCCPIGAPGFCVTAPKLSKLLLTRRKTN